MQTIRYSNKSFPAYRFVPGETPHPRRDPKGHSYDKPLEQLSSFNTQNWNTCEIYLYAIDLFNYRYWWEAHEALEVVWVAAGRDSKPGLFIQGLIQIAAALLKGQQGYHDAVANLALAGLNKMQSIHGYFLGIDVAKLCLDVKSYLSENCITPVIIELNHATLKRNR